MPESCSAEPNKRQSWEQRRCPDERSGPLRPGSGRGTARGKVALSGQNPESTPVHEVMTAAVEMATLATGPGEALATMVERHFRHLPVVDKNGKLLGMLSIRNLLQLRIDDLTQQLDSLEQYVSNDGPGG